MSYRQIECKLFLSFGYFHYAIPVFKWRESESSVKLCLEVINVYFAIEIMFINYKSEKRRTSQII